MKIVRVVLFLASVLAVVTLGFVTLSAKPAMAQGGDGLGAGPGPGEFVEELRGWDYAFIPSNSFTDAETTTDGRHEVIDFAWGTDAPDVDEYTNGDDFTFIWRKTVNFDEQMVLKYEMLADDNMYFFLDGELISHTQGPWVPEASAITLFAGQHEIEVRHHEFGGHARAKFLASVHRPDFSGILPYVTFLSVSRYSGYITDPISIQWQVENLDEDFRLRVMMRDPLGTLIQGRLVGNGSFGNVDMSLIGECVSAENRTIDIQIEYLPPNTESGNQDNWVVLNTTPIDILSGGDWFFDMPSNLNITNSPCTPSANGIVAYQPFEKGAMVWFDQTNDIYVLYNDASIGAEKYKGSWSPAHPIDDPIVEPPAGLQRPIYGFGKLWRESDYIRQNLGFATTGEQHGYSSYQFTYQPAQSSNQLIFGQQDFLKLPSGEILLVSHQLGSPEHVWQILE